MSVGQVIAEQRKLKQAQQNRPALKELLQQLPQLADYQIEALKVVVSDTLTRSQWRVC